MLTLPTGRDDGFSLLEILLVLLILGIAISLVLPSFGQLGQSIEFKAAQRRAIHFFQQARTRAIAANEELVISLAGNTLLLEDEAGQVIAELGRGFGEITFPDEENSLTFFADGTSTGGSLAFITEGGQQFTLVIDQATGRVQALQE